MECRGEKLRYQLKNPGTDGKTALVLSPDEFLDRIAARVPPPRKHRHRYFAVLAPNAPWRKLVIARAGLPVEIPVPGPEDKDDALAASAPKSTMD